MLRLALLCVLPALFSAVAPLGWPTGSVRHRYYDTPNGQIHYVIGGDVSGLPGTAAKQLPMLMLHSHPRSTTEFKYLTADMKPQIPFLAIDYFGMGYSEDYKGDGANDTFCTFEAFAGHALAIAAKEMMEKFVVVGSLKGAHPAIETAYQAGAERSSHIVLMNPLILSPKSVAYIDSMLIPMLKDAKLAANGSHVLAAWNDASAAPVHPWDNGRDLVGNQEKTNDELRCLSTGWQYDAAWTAYAATNEPRMAALDSYAKSLFIYGDDNLANWAMYGLDPQYSLDAFGRALTHGRNSTHFLKNAGEGMVVQNSSVIASMIVDFMGPTRTMV